MNDLSAKHLPWTQEKFDKLWVSGQNILINGLYAMEHLDPTVSSWRILIEVSSRTLSSSASGQSHQSRKKGPRRVQRSVSSIRRHRLAHYSFRSP